MPRTADQILAEIHVFQPVGGNWLPLDDRLAELWAVGIPHSAIPVLLGVFERFPDEDGAGVLWSIVHGLESVPGYEPALLESAELRPTPFKLMMIDRLRRAGGRQT